MGEMGVKAERYEEREQRRRWYGLGKNSNDTVRKKVGSKKGGMLEDEKLDKQHFVVYLTTLSLASNGCIIVNNEQEEMWKKAVVV